MNARLMNCAKALAPVLAITVVQPASAQSEGTASQAKPEARQVVPSPPAPPAPPSVEIPPPAPPAIRIPPPRPQARPMPAQRPTTYERGARPIDQYNWYRNVTMPADLYRQRAEGLVSYQVDLDEEGRPSNCLVTETSGFPALDILTCDIVVSKGKFVSALDEAGDPIASTYSGYKSWDHKPHDLNDFDITIRVVVDENGEQTSCEVVEQTGIMPQGFNGEAPCRGLVRGNGPWRDENGVPQAREMVFKVSIEGSEPIAGGE